MRLLNKNTARRAAAAAAAAVPAALPVLLPPGSTPRPGTHLPTTTDRVYDGFLAAAALSEPQHTIYDS